MIDKNVLEILKISCNNSEYFPIHSNTLLEIITELEKAERMVKAKECEINEIASFNMQWQKEVKIAERALELMANYTLDLEKILIRTGWTYIPDEHSEESINALIGRYVEKARKQR